MDDCEEIDEFERFMKEQQQSDPAKYEFFRKNEEFDMTNNQQIIFSLDLNDTIEESLKELEKFSTEKTENSQNVNLSENLEVKTKENKKFIMKNYTDPIIIPKILVENDNLSETPTSKTGILVNQDSLSLNLDKDITNSLCPYIKTIKKCEFFQFGTETILSNIKKDLGSNLKIILKTRSLTSSPKMKSNNTSIISSIKSESFSDISFALTTKHEENTIEIPSTLELFIENVSALNILQLKFCIISLLAKLTQYEIESKEIPSIVQMLQSQDIKIIGLHEFLIKSENQNFFKNSQNLISGIKTKIQQKKKIFEEKKAENKIFDSKIRELKENFEKSKQYPIMQGLEYYKKIEIIKNLRENINIIEEKKALIENEFKDKKNHYKDSLDQLRLHQVKLIEEKSEIYEKIKQKTKETHDLLKENSKIAKENLKTEENLKLYHSLQESLKEKNVITKSLQADVSKIQQQYSILKSKHKFESDQLKDLILKTTKTNNSISSEISSNLSENYQKLSEKNLSNIKTAAEMSNRLKNILETLSSLEESYNSSTFFITQRQNIRLLITNELEYFSDKLFSQCQTFLQQHRIKYKLASVIENKDYETETMQESISFMKTKNPIYNHIKGDYIDKNLAKYLNSRNSVLSVPFIRENYGIYLYGTRKVSISIERNKLTVKVGGGYMFIEDFINKYTKSELEKYEKRLNPISPQTKQVMAKWVKGIHEVFSTPKSEIRNVLVNSIREHKHTLAFGIKSVSPKTKNSSFRCETPVIEDE